MAKDGFTVVDSDAHYVEPMEEVTKYLDEPWRSRVLDAREYGEHKGGLLPGADTGFRFMSGRIQRDAVSYPSEPMAPEEVPRMMGRVSVDKALLYPNKMLGFARIRSDDDRMVAVANAYVDYMLDQVVDPDRDIYTFIPAPYSDPGAAADLIDRVKDEPGIVGVYLVTTGPEPPLGHHRYDPIYDAAQSADMPVAFHTGGWSGTSFFPMKGYDKMVETHTLGFLWSNLAQITSLTVRGVPEKFPDLDIVFMESGIFYIPTIMHRLDTEYLKRQSEAPLLEKRPSEYMREYYYGTQPLENPEDEEFLTEMIDRVGGADRFMFATDYPHWDYDDPSVVTELSVLSDSEKRRILAGTAEEVYDI